MTEFRVLVADKAKAKLYKLPSRRSALQALPCFINPAAQVPERALGSSRHAYQPKTPLKEHAEEVFVRQVGSALATDARVGVRRRLCWSPRRACWASTVDICLPACATGSRWKSSLIWRGCPRQN